VYHHPEKLHEARRRNTTALRHHWSSLTLTGRLTVASKTPVMPDNSRRQRSAELASKLTEHVVVTADEQLSTLPSILLNRAFEFIQLC